MLVRATARPVALIGSRVRKAYRAVLAWFKNNLLQSGQSLLTDYSASGAEAISNYGHFR